MPMEKLTGHMPDKVKIGDPVWGVIVKDLPGEHAYRVSVADAPAAYLPTRFAGRGYRPGERIMAVVCATKGRRIILSQKSSQYFRRVAEDILLPVIRDGKVRVRNAATIVGSSFAKVAVEGLGNTDPLTASLPYLDRAKEHTPDTITIVRYSTDMRRYVVSSLVPAPVNKVVDVIYSRDRREAIVRVHPEYCGLFVGKGGANVATAAKLLGIKILIETTD